jgi:hypothetical protein
MVSNDEAVGSVEEFFVSPLCKYYKIKAYAWVSSAIDFAPFLI